MSRFGRTPLHVACRSSSVSSLPLPSLHLNVLDDHGFSPLYSSCLSSSTFHHVLSLLAEPGIDISLPDKGGLTAFHAACYHGNVPAALLLASLQFGALVVVRDSIGRTGRDWAVAKMHVDVVKALDERMQQQEQQQQQEQEQQGGQER